MTQSQVQKVPSPSLLTGLFLALLAVVASFTIGIMAAPYIIGDLGGSNDTAIYIIAFYGLGSALSIPLGKPIAAKLGSANALIACLLVFIVCSGLCSIAPNYPLFIVYRFLLGFAGGPFFPILNHLITNLVPEQNTPRMTAIFITILAVGPVFAASWGGFIAYEYVWRWAFYINIPLFSLLAIFLYRGLKHYTIAPQQEPFDLVGYLFFIVGTLPISFSLITAQELDWYRSPLLVANVLIGVPCFLFFLVWTWYHPHPILHLHFFKKMTFSFGIFNLAILFPLYFGTITLLPLWLTLYVQYTPIWIGAMLAGMTIAGLIPSLFIREKLDRFDPRYPLAIAIILLMISCLNTTIFSVDINFGRIVFSRVVAGFGLALFLPPLFQLCFQSFSPDQSMDVITLLQVVRNLTGGVGAALYQILWQRRQIFFHERLGEQLTLFSQQTKIFLQKTEQYLVPGDPLAQLNYYLDRQARALGLNDVFWLMTWILVGLLLILFISFFKRCTKSN